MSANKAAYLSGAFVLVLLLVALTCLFTTETPASPSMITSWTATTGSEGELRTRLTNMAPFSIRLEPPVVRYEDGKGTVFDTPRFLWNGKDSLLSLAPMTVAQLDFQVPSETTRVRVLLAYGLQAGPLHRVVGRCVSWLPLARLSPGAYVWLQQRGFIDGAITRGLEGPWILNPQVQRSAASRVGVDMNSAATPAGSRR